MSPDALTRTRPGRAGQQETVREACDSGKRADVISKTLLRLVLAATLSIPGGIAIGSDAPRSATSKLAQTGEVTCEPALPFFCGNIHVACSGRTTIRTFPFKLRASPSRGWIESAADTSGVKERYENGRLDWEDAKTYVILRPREGNGYVKLLADGRYSFRHYSQGIGTMSYGRCD